MRRPGTRTLVWFDDRLVTYFSCQTASTHFNTISPGIKAETPYRLMTLAQLKSELPGPRVSHGTLEAPS